MTTFPTRFHAHAPAVTTLPEYHAARAALDALVHATLRADVQMTQTEWLDLCTDLAATNPYGDSCRGCPDDRDLMIVYPHTTEPTGVDGLRADYRCPACGTPWSTWWAIDAPLHLS